MSRSDREGGMPPIFKLILSALADRVESVDTADIHHSREDHQEWHQEKIHYWESIREHLAEQFGEMVAADMIEVQRMAARACHQGKAGFSSLIAAVDDLMVVANGDPEILTMAAKMVHDITEKVMTIRHFKEVMDNVSEAMEKTKSKRSKPKAEPGTKAKSETKTEARARIKAEAEAARLREQAENN